MNAARPPIWAALRAHLAADRRKTVVLVVLLVAMAAIYARLFWGSPASAQAGAASLAVKATTERAESQPPAAPVRIKPNRPLVRDLTRDPFAIRMDRFPTDPAAAVARPSAPVAPNPPGARPDVQPAASQQDLRLQSTICGTLPMAWISGRCVQPGESIEGFVLEQVEPARVVLRRGNDVRVLTME